MSTATPVAKSANKPSSKGGSGSFSTVVDWPRPREIPFQAKVANSVTLISRICMPVQSLNGPDGELWAGNFAARDESPDSTPLWFVWPFFVLGFLLSHILAKNMRVKK
ncbi:hypothetical protein BT93_L1386 [Corymbia citriodora subsp. variegata]|uniref:Uncharacterized protein n=1 Tax=Corymbia citriodora subsp. variegata TaxID=360336 RepID=A0A8T0CSB0_CORYI|nr:hypothetical protein BT93_L1386 [Corymbia citriodora subsp. variegata]